MGIVKDTRKVLSLCELIFSFVLMNFLIKFTSLNKVSVNIV